MAESEVLPPLLDNAPMNWIGAAAVIGLTWLIVQLVYAPMSVGFDSFFGSWKEDYELIPIIDFSQRMFDNYLFISYFICWIVYTTIAFVQFISYTLAYANSDPTFMLQWTETVGLYGSTIACAAPWLLTIVHMVTTDWTENSRAISLFNLVGNFVVYAFYASIHVVFTGRMG